MALKPRSAMILAASALAAPGTMTPRSCRNNVRRLAMSSRIVLLSPRLILLRRGQQVRQWSDQYVVDRLVWDRYPKPTPTSTPCVRPSSRAARHLGRMRQLLSLHFRAKFVAHGPRLARR